MVKILSSSFASIHKRGYNFMYMTQSLTEKTEGRMLVSSLMRARRVKKE